MGEPAILGGDLFPRVDLYAGIMRWQTVRRPPKDLLLRVKIPPRLKTTHQVAGARNGLGRIEAATAKKPG
jgi:hypothetical protein